ncbi:MAG: M56 family metallopeptidase, partial [Planctomycetota bacterium]
MMRLEYFEQCCGWLNPDHCWTLAMALAHAVWQGGLAMFLAFGMVRMQWPRTPQARFSLLLTLLLLVGAAPVVNAVLLTQSAARPASIRIAHAEYELTGKLELHSIPDLRAGFPANIAAEAALPSRPKTPTSDSGASRSSPTPPKAFNWALLTVVLATLAYGLGLAVMFVRLARSAVRNWQVAQRCRLAAGRTLTPHAQQQLASIAQRVAGRMGRGYCPKLVAFAGHGAAVVVGLFRPFVLVNASLLTGLRPDQLEQVIAHELAHVYRFDPLTQWLQRVAESVMFFHPAAWYLSRQVSTLRELCCDDWVAQCYAPTRYAETLVTCAEWERQSSALRPSSSLAVSLAVTGSDRRQLTRRVMALLDDAPRPAASTHSRLRSLVALMILSCGLVGAILLFRNASQAHGPDVARPDTTPSNYADPTWHWVSAHESEVDAGDFLFGGALLALEEAIPAEIAVDESIDKQACAFAQWQYGGHESTSVAVLIENQAGASRLFLDRNRDRAISSDEEVTQKSKDGSAWLTRLATEIRA